MDQNGFFWQGATTGIQNQGTPSRPQFAQRPQTGVPYAHPSTYGYHQMQAQADWQAHPSQMRPSGLANSFDKHPPAVAMVNPIVGNTEQRQSPAQSMSMTEQWQNNQVTSQAFRVQSMAYGQPSQFLDHGNHWAASVRGGSHHTQYQYPQYRDPYGVAGQRVYGAPRYDEYDHAPGHKQIPLLEANRMAEQPPYKYHQPVSGSFSVEGQIPVDHFGTATASTDDTLGHEGQTLTTSESETSSLSPTAGAQVADTGNTTAESLGDSSQSSDVVEAAVLSHIRGCVSVTSLTQATTTARPSQQTHKRKRSAESNSSTSSKKSRVEEKAAKTAEKERLTAEKEAERKAAETALTAEARERIRRVQELTARLQTKEHRDRQGWTIEELRIFITDLDLADYRVWFAAIRGIDQWSDDVLRRNYIEQPELFKGEASSQVDKSASAKKARHRESRLKRMGK